MTNEQAVKHLEVIKGDCALVGDIRALDMGISALSAEGEYIKKEDAIYAVEAQLKHLLHHKEFVAKHGERDFLPLINEIKAIPTRSIPETATSGEYVKKDDILNELGDTNMDILTDEVKEIVNGLPSYSFPDSAEKLKAEIEDQKKWLSEAGYNAYNVDIAFSSIRNCIGRQHG